VVAGGGGRWGGGTQGGGGGGGDTLACGGGGGDRTMKTGGRRFGGGGAAAGVGKGRYRCLSTVSPVPCGPIGLWVKRRLVTATTLKPPGTNHGSPRGVTGAGADGGRPRWPKKWRIAIGCACVSPGIDDHAVAKRKMASVGFRPPASLDSLPPSCGTSWPVCAAARTRQGKG